MLDKSLQYWKSYQKWRCKRILTMANKIPCNFNYRGLHFIQGTLSIFSVGEQRLEVRQGKLCITVPLEDVRGFNLEGQNICLTLWPEGEPPIILEFQTPDIQAVAFTQLEDFASEIVHSPTPPSTGSSESD